MKSLESGYIGNTCGNIRFHGGDKLLLYANETDQADRVSTWHCMRTRPLAEAKEDLDIIAAMKPATSPAAARTGKSKSSAPCSS